METKCKPERKKCCICGLFKNQYKNNIQVGGECKKLNQGLVFFRRNKYL